MGRGAAHLAKRCASWKTPWAATSVFDGHGFSFPRWSSGSLWHGKRRKDVNAVFAKSDVYRAATGFNQLLFTALMGHHNNDVVALTNGPYKPAFGSFFFGKTSWPASFNPPGA
jgi:hypothetical protein